VYSTPGTMAMKLDLAACVDDMREMARRRLPRMIFDLIDGGAEGEFTMRANREAYTHLAFRPSTLVDVSTRDLRTTVAGLDLKMPLLLAPAAGTRIVHPEAERAVARAAGRHSIPYVVTARSSFTIEELRDASDGPLWFAVEVIPEDAVLSSLLQRAASAKFDALVFIVDAPVAGRLERSIRTGALPAQYTLANVIDAARKPRWSMGFLRTAHLIAARNVDESTKRTFPPRPTVPGHALSAGPKRNWDELTRVRRKWDGPFAIKGIICAEDARRAVELGVDMVIVSNHGGRSLDGLPATLSVLPEIVDAVNGKAQVLIDGGVRRGTDIAKALALGASACLIGRPYHYGLGAAGEDGVARVLEMLRDELDRTLAFLGCNSVRDLSRRHLRLASGASTKSDYGIMDDLRLGAELQ
jgi:L-lactate dehydrogenase (cytochrome)